ncbi:hypothetical protein [Streptomyces sp. NBC_01361]|uniref:hypothetical protein n=1 Tax=Streptomyces sp. NBC_01361 TaxID=2903838 RepID=UPI002E32A154|nr:hypothetical protein [Streptomyces sp. NBC_01361]
MRRRQPAPAWRRRSAQSPRPPRETTTAAPTSWAAGESTGPDGPAAEHPYASPCPSPCLPVPASPPISYCARRAAFDQIGLLPRQVWTDRILYEAQQTADPVHLVRLFGIHPGVAVKYVQTAHPDKALPRIR